MKKIMIIGGGASGIVAAISAARCGAEVTVAEHMDRIGKKILSTGNGKCNYTNRKQGLRCYRGENPAFVLPVFQQFGFEETISFFREIGIFPKERNGYFYPASGQATSVLEVLCMELKRLNITVLTNCNVISIQKKENLFLVSTDSRTFHMDCCIFACGGKAFPKSGSDGSAFFLIKKMGHSLIDVVPALVQMKSGQSFFPSIAGIRADILIKLYIDGKIVCQDRGEVQLTKEGISGIPAFQVSRYAAKGLKRKQKVTASLDFLPWLSKKEVRSELSERFYRNDGKTTEEAFIGLFSKKLIPLFLRENQISTKALAKGISEVKIKELAAYLKNMQIEITGTEGFDKAQAMAGGVNTEEICSQTLESRLMPGLYFAGEVIDIDGICGGYNLQWAWSSGYVAGMHAAGDGKMKKQEI